MQFLYEPVQCLVPHRSTCSGKAGPPWFGCRCTLPLAPGPAQGGVYPPLLTLLSLALNLGGLAFPPSHALLLLLSTTRVSSVGGGGPVWPRGAPAVSPSQALSSVCAEAMGPGGRPEHGPALHFCHRTVSWSSSPVLFLSSPRGRVTPCFPSVLSLPCSASARSPPWPPTVPGADIPPHPLHGVLEGLICGLESVSVYVTGCVTVYK